MAKGVQKEQVALITLQWSLMMSSGIDIIKALDTMERACANQAEANMFGQIRQRLLAGNYLSRALADFPPLFSPLYLALIQVGETTGALARVMERLAEWLRREGDLSQKVRSALIYPFLVLTVAMLLLLTVFATILPGLTEVLQESGAELPWYSRLTLGLVNAIRTPIFWVVIFSGVLAVAALLRERLSNPQGRDQLYRLTLALPVLGPMLASSALARFATSAAFMLEVGIDICKSLRLAAASSGSPVLREEMEQVLAGLQQGEPLSDLFAHLTDAPPILWRMTQVGEEAARLPAIFKHLASHFESEVEYRIEAMLALLEPLMMLLLAAMVGFTAVSIMIPLYGSLSNLG